MRVECSDPPPPGSRRGAWLAVAALLLGNLVLHKPISDVCDALFARIGRAPYEWIMLLGIGILSLLAAILLLRGGAPALRSRPALAALAGLTALTVVGQRLLLVSNVELIHLPQFGLQAALLLAVGLPPQLAWLGAVAAGVIDETYQHLVIYRGVPDTYFDWNDIVLNAVGAAWVVVLACGGRIDAATPGQRRLQAGLLAALLVGLAVALGWAPPLFTPLDRPPYWTPALRAALTGRQYHVMPAFEGLAALALLWGLVALACRPVRAAVPARAALALLFLVLPGCVPRRPLPPPMPPLPPRPFFVTCWCGPPLAEFTDARAAELAAAGFDVVGSPCEGRIDAELTRRALDIAARHGLKMWVNDGRVDQYHGLRPDWEAQLAAAVADLGPHPALDGYFLVDEPGHGQFADLGLVVTRLRQLDPTRVPYINLLPDYIPAAAWGTRTYAEHVDWYLAEVRPPLLSVAYYPFREDGDRPSFFANLGLIRDRARAAGVPWLLIVQAMPHGPYRDPTPAELSWQVFHGLAFGARAISYFAYWTPVAVPGADDWQFRRGLVEHGVATDKLATARDLNAAARAVADQLDGWASIAVVDSAGAFGDRLPVPPIAALDGGAATVGVFAAPDGRRAALVVNRDYRAAAEIALVTQPGAPAAEAFDPAARRWRLAPDTRFTLAPGGAQLVRWCPAECGE
jgi:hypothetical protein